MFLGCWCSQRISGKNKTDIQAKSSSAVQLATLYEIMTRQTHFCKSLSKVISTLIQITLKKKLDNNKYYIYSCFTHRMLQPKHTQTWLVDTTQTTNENQTIHMQIMKVKHLENSNLTVIKKVNDNCRLLMGGWPTWRSDALHDHPLPLFELLPHFIKDTQLAVLALRVSAWRKSWGAESQWT